MKCPDIQDLPNPLTEKQGFPFTEQSEVEDLLGPHKGTLPKISIVIPSFNQAQYLEQAIRSVLLQGYPDLELLVMDGGSTDGSVEVIKKYEPWLHYWQSERDRGQSHAINMGIERSGGKYFNWVNSDDLLTPASLIYAAIAMEAHPQASYVHGGRIFLDDQDQILKRDPVSETNTISFWPTSEEAVRTLKAGAQPGSLMKLDLVRQVGGIDESLHYIMDADILVRLAAQEPPIHLDRTLTFVRIYHNIKSNVWDRCRAGERLIVANKIFTNSQTADKFAPVRRRCYARAHRFAWTVHAKAKNYLQFGKHFFLDIYYSNGTDWQERIHDLIHLKKYASF